MTAFTDACKHAFSNGTEAESWMAKWCHCCARDHGMHNGGDTGRCPLIFQTMLGSDSTWPEGWLPEPDDGAFHLPPRHVCLAFTPCEPCGGDPGAEPRATCIAEVTAYWKARA